METLEIMVNELYESKNTMKEIDYITIMNILKEHYLHITNQLGYDETKEELEAVGICECCMETTETLGDFDFDDTLCNFCYNDRPTSEDEEEQTYTGTYR